MPRKHRYLDETPIGDYKLKGRQWKKMSYGTNDETRQRVYNSFPELVHVTDSIAKEYNISPNLLRTRIANEGFIDGIARNVDDRINSGDTLINKNEYIRKVLKNDGTFGFGDTGLIYFGLDDVGTLIDEGKVKPIRENYETTDFTNERGRTTLGVNGVTNYDNIGLTAATLQYFKNIAKKEYPKATDKELNRYANIFYNRGVSGGKSYISKSGKGYELKYMIGGNIRPSLKNGGIYIKPSHRGRFTALKERTGHSATWFKENGTPAQKKMATFALNAAKWKH